MDGLMNSLSLLNVTAARVVVSRYINLMDALNAYQLVTEAQ